MPGGTKSAASHKNRAFREKKVSWLAFFTGN
jgi:hypothetical protein